MASLPTIAAARGRLKILRKPVAPALPSTPRPERRDCHGRLIAAVLEMADGAAQVEDASLKPWCSATFVGAQHRITLLLDGEEAADRSHALAKALPEAEFAIPGHLVADLTIDAISKGEKVARVTMTALTIEDW